VTVYRLVSKNTIEERILHRAKQKDHIQKMVISGDQVSSDNLYSTSNNGVIFFASDSNNAIFLSGLVSIYFSIFLSGGVSVCYISLSCSLSVYPPTDPPTGHLPTGRGITNSPACLVPCASPILLPGVVGLQGRQQRFFQSHRCVHAVCVVCVRARACVRVCVRARTRALKATGVHVVCVVWVSVCECVRALKATGVCTPCAWFGFV
jgi:hypothetical protein